jgi:hypothetical protein
MQQQEGYKKFLPHLLIIAIFIAISCAFCYPAFQGKTLDQHDIKTWLWNSKEGRDYHEKTGEAALWANNMFGGMPQATVDGYNDKSWYSHFIHAVEFDKHGLPQPNPAIYFFVAMICFYILANTLRVNKWLGAIGALAFAFSAYNATIITAGHTTKMLDIAYIPALLAGLIIAYRGKYLQGAALFGLFMAFAFDASHLQIIYYTMLLIGLFVLGNLVEAIREKKFKIWLIASIALITAGGIAFMTQSSSLLQTLEYAKYSSRGGGSELTIGNKEKSTGLDKDYAFSWSNGVGESFTLLVPNLYGGSVDEKIGENSALGKKLSDLGQPAEVVEQMTDHANLYWGPQPLLSGGIYFGAVICLLFVLALFVIRSNMKWWLAGAAFLMIFFAMGKNFSTLNYFMFDHFPYFSKFRSPNMATAVASAIFPILAIWALKDIFEEKMSKEELLKKIKLSLIITGGLCALILIATQVGMDYKGENDAAMQQQYGQVGPDIMKAIREDRKSHATGDAARSLVFVVLAGGILWAYGKDKATKMQMVAALGILIAIDMIPVAHRYLNADKFLDTEEYMTQNFTPSATDAQILQDKDPYYRVLDLTTNPFSDSKPSYFHKTLGGYSAAKIQVYQDLIENQLGNMNGAVLNMLNTKYIIANAGKTAVAVPNPNALGNAWFVSDVKWVKNADEEMLGLNAPKIDLNNMRPSNPNDTSVAASGAFNPAKTAIMRDTFKASVGTAFGKDAAAYVKLTPDGYTPKKMTFESNNTQEGLAVFSDVFYPIGWTAKIDGKETPILKADYVLRAIKVPAGKHTITFEFTSKAYELGNKLALIGSILLTLLIIAAIYFGFFAKKNAENTHTMPAAEKINS